MKDLDTRFPTIHCTPPGYGVKKVGPYEHLSKPEKKSFLVPLSIGYDGVVIAKDFWILCAVLELLPRSIRYQARNIVVVSILSTKAENLVRDILSTGKNTLRCTP